MNYQDLYDYLNDDITNIIHNIPSDDTVSIKLLTNVITQIVKDNLTDTNLDDEDRYIKNTEKHYTIKVADKFSGRGNAWIRIDQNDEVIWNKVIRALSKVDINDEYFYTKSSYLDMFNDLGFAWLRFGGSSPTKGTQFHLRWNGSKNIIHTKIYVSNVEALNLNLLEGVPHKLSLESGTGFIKQEKKVFNDPEVSSNNCFMTLEDIIDND